MSERTECDKATVSSIISALCGLQKCKNTVCWLEDIKGVPHESLGFYVNEGRFLCWFYVSGVFSFVFYFSCQYQCNQLTGKTRL